MLDMVSVISSSRPFPRTGSSVMEGVCLLYPLLRAGGCGSGVSYSSGGGWYDCCKAFGRVRGGPKREGTKPFGRPIPVGDDEPAIWDVEGAGIFRTGDAGRFVLRAGDADLAWTLGDAGRARIPPIPPIRDGAAFGAGDPDLGIPETKRVTCAGAAGTSFLSGLLGPATLRNLSSS